MLQDGILSQVIVQLLGVLGKPHGQVKLLHTKTTEDIVGVGGVIGHIGEEDGGDIGIGVILTIGVIGDIITGGTGVIHTTIGVGLGITDINRLLLLLPLRLDTSKEKEQDTNLKRRLTPTRKEILL